MVLSRVTVSLWFNASVSQDRCGKDGSKTSELHWIARVLVMHNAAAPEKIHRHARAIFAAVSGAQLTPHSHGDVSIFEEIVATYREAGFIP